MVARKEIQISLQGINIYDVYRECPPAKKIVNNSFKFLKSIYEKTTENEIVSEQEIMINTLNRISSKQRLEKIMKNSTLQSNSEELETDLTKITEKEPRHRSLWPDFCLPDPFPTDFFNRLETKNKLHVRTNITYATCNKFINGNYTMGDSLKTYNNTLLKSELRIWFYAGDTDGAVPFTGTIKWIPKLNMEITEPYRKWFVNGKTAGYIQSYDSFVYITIMGTGHMAPQWKREESYIMFNAFLKGERLPEE
jgi:carboxypeptidase C (cathepsin A)